MNIVSYHNFFLLAYIVLMLEFFFLPDFSLSKKKNHMKINQNTNSTVRKSNKGKVN